MLYRCAYRVMIDIVLLKENLLQQVFVISFIVCISGHDVLFIPNIFHCVIEMKIWYRYEFNSVDLSYAQRRRHLFHIMQLFLHY